MALQKIQTRTTWNDAAEAINNNFSTLVQTTGEVSVSPEADTIVKRDDNSIIHTFFLTDDNYVYAFPSSANGYEDAILLSSESLKTLNGVSLIGEGNIVTAHAETYYASPQGVTMPPNTSAVINLDTGRTLRVALTAPTNMDVVNTYELLISAAEAIVSFNKTIVWKDGTAPDLSSTTRAMYKISIKCSSFNGGATYLGKYEQYY